MINKIYIHLKTGNEYLVRELLEMKSLETEGWHEAVLYQSLDSGRSYVRALVSFEKSFAEKEIKVLDK